MVCIGNIDLAVSGFWILIYIQGRMADHAGFINLQEYPGSIAGVCQCPVKIPVFGKLQIVCSIFQGTPGYSILEFYAEKFLHIVVMHRPWHQLQKIIVFHIALKFHHILVSPGKKAILLPAPFQKSADCPWKRDSFFQFMIIHVDHFMDTVVDPVVHFGLDQALKGINDLSFFI